jgi:hypothetical protein
MAGAEIWGVANPIRSHEIAIENRSYVTSADYGLTPVVFSIMSPIIWGPGPSTVPTWLPSAL